MTDHTEAKANVYTCTALFVPTEAGGYVVTFPAFPNLTTKGTTLEEARAMAADCLLGHLEWRMEEGLPLPTSEDNIPGTIREPITVTLPAALDTDALEDEMELEDPEVNRILEESRDDYLAGRTRPAKELLDELEREARDGPAGRSEV